MSCSVLVLTYNEAANIRACLDSLPWRDDMHVLDSGSTDGTADIARAVGATVHTRPFTDYADQRNAGLALPFRNEWIVMLDADERMTADLADEIDLLVKCAGRGLAMACMRRKDMFMDRWLRRASGYPTWFARLLRRGRVTVERDVNEEYVALGEVVRLSGHLIHHPFAKGADWWFDRHNRYSAMEARRLGVERAAGRAAVSAILSRDPMRRRAARKQLLYRMPCRPLVVFFYLYVVRRGFLDGRPGYVYATMRAAYEIMIDAKIAAAESD